MCSTAAAPALSRGAKSPRTLVGWWIPLGLLAALLAALVLVAAVNWYELIAQYPNSVRLAACGHSGIASGAPTSPRAAPPVYLYTQACFITPDTPAQVDTWYRQQGWQYSPPGGMVRLANWYLGLVVLSYQQTTFTQVKGGLTTIYIGYVVDINPTWP
jgi:hypothetical protein